MRTRRVAVVGCGHWGQNLVRVFNQLDSLAMVCEAAPAGRQRASEIAPKAVVVPSFQQVLDSSVEGVVVATPAETHFPLAKQVLSADKDLLVEKPMALTYEEGLQLVQLAEKHSRILMVGHVLEYHPAIMRLIEIVRSGELGDLYYIYSDRLALGKVRREENILWSFAPHDIAVILRIMDSIPVQVIASGGAYLQPEIADVTVTNLLFDTGARAHIHVSWLHPFKEQRLVVIGSRKMASFDDISKRLVLYDQRVEVREGETIPVRGKAEEVSFPTEEPLLQECRAFLDALVSRKPPITDGHSALQVLQVLQAAQSSMMANGAPVTLPAYD